MKELLHEVVSKLEVIFRNSENEVNLNDDKVVLEEPVETAKSHLIQALDYLSRSLLLHLKLMLSTEFGCFVSGKVAQVIETIPWVRCASGNVFFYIKV